MESYFTLQNEYEHKLEIKRSVFICNIKGITNYDEGIDYFKNISKKYSDATHNCYALRTIDDKQKFFDDGEPSGTAGQPILQALKNNDLYNTIAIVTRYFGGIKLGVGGLASAYTQVVTEAIKEATLVEKVLSSKGKIKVSYTEIATLNSYAKDTKVLLLDTQYTDNIEIVLACPIEAKEDIQTFISALTSGREEIEWLENDYFIYT